MTRSNSCCRPSVWAMAIVTGLTCTSLRSSKAWTADDFSTGTPPPLVLDAPSPPKGAARANSVRTVERDAPEARPRPGATPPKAVAEFEGTPANGLEVTLRAKGPTGEGLRYRWVQTRGPVVRLDNAAGDTARFTVLEGEGPLGFLLVVSDGQEIDVAEVTIPLEGAAQSSEEATASVRADAGDDQLGLVGRQVTLNGVRSQPKGRIGYRWVQVGGPRVRMKIEDGYIYSFLPTSPGVYRFALVVAEGSRISESNLVTVTVGSGLEARLAAVEDTSGSVTSPVPIPTQEIARNGVAAVGCPGPVAEELARVFEDTADRMDLYETYIDAYTEMSKRLEVFLAHNPSRRELWVERLFTPMTARVLEVMRAEGLDLRRPEGQASPLASNQKAALTEQFRLMAEGFRSAGRSR